MAIYLRTKNKEISFQIFWSAFETRVVDKTSLQEKEEAQSALAMSTLNLWKRRMVPKILHSVILA